MKLKIIKNTHKIILQILLNVKIILKIIKNIKNYYKTIKKKCVNIELELELEI